MISSETLTERFDKTATTYHSDVSSFITILIISWKLLNIISFDEKAFYHIILFHIIVTSSSYWWLPSVWYMIYYIWMIYVWYEHLVAIICNQSQDCNSINNSDHLCRLHTSNTLTNTCIMFSIKVFRKDINIIILLTIMSKWEQRYHPLIDNSVHSNWYITLVSQKKWNKWEIFHFYSQIILKKIIILLKLILHW